MLCLMGKKVRVNRQTAKESLPSDIELQRQIDVANSSLLPEARREVVRQIRNLERLRRIEQLSGLQDLTLASLRRRKASIDFEINAIAKRASARASANRRKGGRRRVVQGPAQGVTSVVSGGSPGLGK